VVRRGLVTVELALAVLLLVGAGLMLRSFARLTSEEVGLRAVQVATLETTFARADPADRRRVINAVLAQLSGDPSIRAAGAVNDLPLRGGGGISVTIDVPGAPPPKPGEFPGARNLYASADYFTAMGIPILRGRSFRASDAGGAPVAIINRTMASAYWPGRDPIGSYFTWRGDTTRFTVIGVVGDVREGTLAKDPTPQMYRNLEEYTPVNVALLARGTLPPAALIARLQEAVRVVAPSQPVYNVRTMEDVIGNSVRPQRTNTVLIGIFAGLALMLAALGVYSVVSHGVAQRTREFGIRAALGATQPDLVRLVSRELLASIGAGLALGLLGAWAFSRLLGALLYEIDPRDPLTFATVPLVLILPAVIATLIPALRATRVNPTEVMRTD
jgi:putative ABC transport system permease protein